MTEQRRTRRDNRKITVLFFSVIHVAYCIFILRYIFDSHFPLHLSLKINKVVNSNTYYIYSALAILKITQNTQKENSKIPRLKENPNRQQRPTSAEVRWVC